MRDYISWKTLFLMQDYASSELTSFEDAREQSSNRPLEFAQKNFR